MNDKLHIDRIECTPRNPLKSVLLQILSDMTKDVEFNYFKDTPPYRGVYLDISCEYNLCNMYIDIATVKNNNGKNKYILKIEIQFNHTANLYAFMDIRYASLKEYKYYTTSYVAYDYTELLNIVKDMILQFSNDFNGIFYGYANDTCASVSIISKDTNYNKNMSLCSNYGVSFLDLKMAPFIDRIIFRTLLNNYSNRCTIKTKFIKTTDNDLSDAILLSTTDISFDKTIKPGGEYYMVDVTHSIDTEMLDTIFEKESPQRDPFAIIYS